MISQKFNRWTIVDKTTPYEDKRGYFHKKWKCLCECGTIKDVLEKSLFNNRSKSCACLTKERSTEVHFKGYGVAGFNRVKSTYKQNAKKRNIEFTLSDDQLKLLFTGNCYYCGIGPTTIQYPSSGRKRNLLLSYNNGSFKYNGIDRLDNNKGYFIDNCVSCCNDCNWAKRDKTLEQFLIWINRFRNL